MCTQDARGHRMVYLFTVVLSARMYAKRTYASLSYSFPGLVLSIFDSLAIPLQSLMKSRQVNLLSN